MLLELIKKQGLEGDIKLIGVGAKNSVFEVETFRKAYQIPFPLVPDTDRSAHKAWGRVWTPHFFVLQRMADGSLKVLISLEGKLPLPEAFLAEIKKKAGL